MATEQASATIYHNPCCSKSREALRLLLEAGAEVTVIDYLTTPPDQNTLRRLFAGAGLVPQEGLRADAPAAARMDATAALRAMAADPALIERPLVETAKGVVLARPPERVREIL